MASPLDIQITQNNDITILFTVKDKTGNIINITDFNIVWEVKKSYLSPELITKKTGGYGIIITNPTLGQFAITINAADTVSIEPGSYFHQATVGDNVGNHVSLTGLGGSTGTFTLLPEYAVQD